MKHLRCAFRQMPSLLQSCLLAVESTWFNPKHSKSEHFHSKAAPKCEKLKYSSQVQSMSGFLYRNMSIKKKHLSLLIYPLNISKHHLHTCLNSQSKYFTGTCDPGGLCWRFEGCLVFRKDSGSGRYDIRIYYRIILNPTSPLEQHHASIGEHSRLLISLHCLPRTISTNCSISSYHEDS